MGVVSWRLVCLVGVVVRRYITNCGEWVQCMGVASGCG